MIENLSKYIASYLGNNLRSDQDEITIYTYALQIIIGVIVKFSIIIILAILMDTYDTALVFLLTFSFFRWIGGGTHLSNYLACLLFGVFLVCSMAKACQLWEGTSFLVPLFIVVLVYAVFVCIRWVPGGTEKKAINNPIERKKQKKEAFIALTIWSVMVLCLIHVGKNSLVLAAILAVFWSSFFISPWGYRAIGMIDYWINNRDKEVYSDVEEI